MNPIPFWVVLGLSMTSWLLYPAFLTLLSLLRREPNWTEPREWPRVSVLIAARNEVAVIADRIRNLLGQDYPGKIDILIGSDCSDDGTDEVVRSFEGDGVILYRSSERRGKPLMIQDLLGLSYGEILVFTDADTVFAPDTVRRLVLPYSDPGVGCVDGSRRNSLEGPSCESVYWRYERAIKRLCSRWGAVLGATGAVFSLRRDAFRPLSPRRADDFELAVMARMQGYRCVFSDLAVAAEPSPDDSSQYRRMVRIVSWMMVSCLLLMGRALAAGRLFLFLQLLCHKLLRWFSGILLAGATVLAGFLFSVSPVYSIIFSGLCLFHALAVVGRLSACRLPSKLLFPFYFWLMNMAAIEGIFRTLCGRPVETWESGRSINGGSGA